MNFYVELMLSQFSKVIEIEHWDLSALFYPSLKKVKYPEIAEKLGINNEEWQDLLKIVIDYYIRYSSFLVRPIEVKPYLTKKLYSDELYSNSSEITKVKKFPKFEETRANRTA